MAAKKPVKASAKKATKPVAKASGATKGAKASTPARKGAVAAAKKPATAVKKAATKPAGKAAAKASAKTPVRTAHKKATTKAAPKKAAPAKSAAKPAAKAAPAKKPSAAKPAAKPATSAKPASSAKPAAKAAVKTAASKNSVKPAGPSKTPAARPVGTGAKAVPPERHERTRQEPEPRRQATTPPAQQPAPVAAAAPLRRLRPIKPTKDMYSAATGTNTSDPFPQKELERFRSLIMDTRSDSIEELEMLTEQLREMTAREVGEDNNAYSLHMAEQGTDAMEREKTFLQAQRTSDYVKKLGEALERIDNKSFGICRICGLRLDSKRLLAVPVTQVCTVYKNTSKPCEPGRLHMLALGVNDEEGT